MRRRVRRMLATSMAGVLALGSIAGGPASAGPTGGALPPVLIDVIRIGGTYGIPDDAAMVAATITAIEPAENGWIKAFACDGDVPDTASLNYRADEVANNLALARLAANGTLCIATRAVTDYVVDVNGYVPAGSPITPLPSAVRALDTRDGTGGQNPSPVPDGATVRLTLAGQHGIPADASLAIFNLTAVGGPTGGRITAHPCDRPPATTSSVNFGAGRNVGNLVVSRLSGDGTVCFLTKNASDIVVDVAGYSTGGIATFPTPRRVLDTRKQGGILAAGSITTVDPGLPDDASSAIYNLTAVGAPTRGFATAYPCDKRRPTSSNLNFAGPQAVGVGSITKLAADGTFCLFTKSDVHLVVDMIGHTTDTSTYVPITPTRAKDTRRGWKSTCDWAVSSSSANGPVVAMHSVSGVRKTMYDVGPGGSIVDEAMVDPTCRYAYFTTRPDNPQGPLLLHRFSLARGNTVRAGRVPRGLAGMGIRADGTIATVTHEGDVAVAGTSVDYVIEPYGDFEIHVRDADVAAEADLLATMSGGWTELEARNGLHGPSTVEVRDLVSGTLISRFNPPDFAAEIDISPDGRYVLLRYPADPIDADPPQHLEVRTIYGDVVDRVDYTTPFSNSRNLVGWFAGNGELHMCVGPLGTYRWQLFGPITQLLDVEQTVYYNHDQCRVWQ